MKTAYSSEKLAAMSQLAATARSGQSYMEGIRHELHAHPEVRYEGRFTRGVIKRELDKFVGRNGIQQHVELIGGIIVEINVAGATKRRLFRADFDALPNKKGETVLEEQTGLPFASKIKGRIHSCGHDVHTAMLLGFVRSVAEGEVVLTANVLVVFQDAEENPDQGESGGAALVREGVLSDVDEAHALHIWAEKKGEGDLGVFYSMRGPMLGCSDRLKVKVKGKGGHVMNPDSAPNANDIASEINVALRRLQGDYPKGTVSLRTACIVGGTMEQSNGMPAEADMMCAIRSFFDETERRALHGRVRQEVETIASCHGGSAEVTIIDGHPSLINSERLYDEGRALIESAGMVVGKMERGLGGEDFAWYGESQGGIPCCMWMLGAYQQGFGGHHTATFNPDETVMWQGLYFWLLQATK